MFKEVFVLSVLALVVYGVPGGWETVDVEEAQVKVAAGHAAETLSDRFAGKYHHKLVKVLKAEQQVVAGMNFRLDVVVGLTTCEKSEVAYEKVGECGLQDNRSTYKKCQVVVYKDLESNHRLISSGCILISRDEV